MSRYTAHQEGSYTWEDAERIVRELMRPEADQIGRDQGIKAIQTALVSDVRILKRVLPELLDIMTEPLREKNGARHKKPLSAREKLESSLALLGEEARASLEEKARIKAVVKKTIGKDLELP